MLPKEASEPSSFGPRALPRREWAYSMLSCGARYRSGWRSSTGRHGAALRPRQREDSQRMRTRAECNDARESSYALSATYTGKPLSFRENQSLLKPIRNPRMNLHRAQRPQKGVSGLKRGSGAGATQFFNSPDRFSIVPKKK